MSESQVEGIGLDDATLETPLNQGAETQQEGQALSELLQEPVKEDSRPPNKEPGWVQKRIDGALQKKLPDLVAAEVAKVRAEYEARIKPLLDAQLVRDADELVRDGEFKSKERALEYLRLKGGIPLEKAAETQKTAEPPSEYDVRAEALIAQAEYAKKMDGIDPMEIYKGNPEIAARVNSGEWDFSDVVKAVKKSPSPIYSSNNATPQKKGIHDLSPQEWKTLNENISKGVRVNAN